MKTKSTCETLCPHVSSEVRGSRSLGGHADFIRSKEYAYQLRTVNKSYKEMLKFAGLTHRLKEGWKMDGWMGGQTYNSMQQS